MRNLFSLLSSTELGIAILAASSYLLPGARAVNFPSVPSSNLDLSQLGRVAIAGDFDAISLYDFVGQSQNGLSTNGSHSLLSRFPTGAFATLQTADAYIRAMCSFVQKDGSLAGVVVGGNFTSLGGVETQGIAIFQPNTSTIQPMPGLNGSVNALFCDNSSNTVYVGGSFTGANSTNAIAWTSSWTNLPFAGFNGPVNSITKAANGNIIFGGSFDGLGNTTTPTVGDGQVIPITSANLSAGPSTTEAGFSNPSNIVCETGQGGSGNTWLLADNSPGEWTANFEFGFIPSKLRLWNTNQDGRGTQTFRFTALPINGIMNFTYLDANGVQQSCTSQCPLAQNTSAQDFTFVNEVGMNGFRIDISAWYGAGGGLGGIELFDNDIYTFAINDFNEPNCDAVANPAMATTTGPWTITPSGSSASEYLTADLSGTNIDPESATVVFEPDIQQAGNYSVTIFTPGCISDNTCNTRGRVNITGQFGSGTSSASQPVSTQLFQTNNYDKYDQIYFGFVDATSSSFRPSVTLQLAVGQNGPLTVVAQRVRFELLAGSGGLNGLFDYNPNQANVSTDFSNDIIDAAGNSLNAGATVNALAEAGSTLYVAGNFSSSSINNIFSVGSNATSLPEGGLNGAVNAMYQNGSTLYVGGAFTGTTANSTQGLIGIGSFNTGTNVWVPLGAGVNGIVNFVVPFNLNLTGSSQPVLALGISGEFSQINAFSNFTTVIVSNFAVWVPSKNNWLQNLNIPTVFVSGILVSEANVPGYPQLYSGSVISQTSSASGGVELTGTSTLALQQFPVQEKDSQPVTVTRRKRQLSNIPSQSITGIVTGAFIDQNNLNITALGGHFTATASNGSTINNLLLINGSNSDQLTGLTAGVSPDSVFLTLGASGTLLFAGGNVTGNVNGNAVNGLIVYDMAAANYASTQPPSLTGNNVAVSAIAPQPSSTAVYVGGNFAAAGTFSCPALCVFDTSRSQWNSPGNGLNGTVTALSWIGDTSLLIGGALTISGNNSVVATYNPKTETFSTISNTGGPTGTVTALTAGSSDGLQIWVAGENSDGSAFFSKWDGSKWNAVTGLLGTGSLVRGLQMFSLTQNHASSPLISDNTALVLFGQLQITGFGNASAAIYNGTTLTPFLLANTAANGAGSLSSAFVQNPQNFFLSSSKYNPVLIFLKRTSTNVFLQVTSSRLASSS